MCSTENLRYLFFWSSSKLKQLMSELICLIVLWSALLDWGYMMPTTISNLNVVPSPTRDSTWMVPCMASTMSLLIMRPSPTPSLFNPLLSSSFPKALNSLVNFSGAMPTPVSYISKLSILLVWSFSSIWAFFPSNLRYSLFLKKLSQETLKVICPFRVNFKELPNKLMKTCFILFGSVKIICGTSGALNTLISMPRDLACS